MQETVLLDNKSVKRPKLAFVGTGWIGLNRMQAILSENISDPIGIVDVLAENVRNALNSAPGIKSFDNIDELVNQKPDGIVIATPSALHAKQSIQALENDIAVFCQKPLARTAEETLRVIKAAEKANKLLGVDFSYRLTDAMQKIHKLVHEGTIGEVYAVDLVFHNAWGPDKNWFYNPKLSGGGCVIDLGIHLVDLAMWMLDFPGISKVSSTLMANGENINDISEQTEDYAVAQLTTEKGAVINLSCSWNLQAGQDAVIKASFYGSKGGANFSNINGSFYDFTADHYFNKTAKKNLSMPPDDWGGRAAIEWIKKLKKGETFNEEAYDFVKVAEIIDQIYGR